MCPPGLRIPALGDIDLAGGLPAAGVGPLVGLTYRQGMTTVALVTGANKGIGFETARIPSLVGRRSLPSETSLDDVRAVYEVNVLGLVAVTDAMLPLLHRAPAGPIVNVSSEVGPISSMTDPSSPLAPVPPCAQYPSSTSAVNMLTAMYAREFLDIPIKVNAANPGSTATDVTQHRGFRSAAEGAEPTVHLATLPDDGPSGILWGHIRTTAGDGGYGTLGW